MVAGAQYIYQLADFSGASILSISKLEKFRGQLGLNGFSLKVITPVAGWEVVTGELRAKIPFEGSMMTLSGQGWRSAPRREKRQVVFADSAEKPHGCVKYENLLEHTPATLRSICTFLGIDYSENMIGILEGKTPYR